MDTDTFRACLAQLDWSQAEFCRRAGIAISTAQRWTAAGTVPGYAAMIVRLALQLRGAEIV